MSAFCVCLIRAVQEGHKDASALVFYTFQSFLFLSISPRLPSSLYGVAFEAVPTCSVRLPRSSSVSASVDFHCVICLRVFGNGVLRKILSPKRNEVTGKWRRLHNEELYGVCSSPNIIRVLKSRI